MDTNQNRIIVKVIVTAVCKSLHPDDENIAGEYTVSLPAEATPVASCALDSFHEHVPIKVLDDFEIHVVDEEGNVIEELEDAPAGYESLYRGHVY